MSLQRTPHLLAVTFALIALSVLDPPPARPQTDSPPSPLPAAPAITPAIINAPTGLGEEPEVVVPVRPSRRDRALAVPTRPAARSLEIRPSSKPFHSPELQDFIARVRDGASELVRGVFVEGVLAAPVVQQPEKNVAFVSEEKGVITQFRSASDEGVIGLLAHNYLAGRSFYELEIGKHVVIVMGDGATYHYVVSEIARFKKLSPSSLRSNLVDLSTGKTVTTPQAFNRFYRGQPKVTFQTCLEREGLLNWGLIFVVASPLEE